MYGHRDLIIDVVNAKFDWGNSTKENTCTFDNFCNRMSLILNAVADISAVRFFIAGFSRGGLFSLRLAKWLKDNGYGK
ncbi:MAG: hypothetical protein ACLFQB_12245 [Chitinispirillaceae bacterium]